MFCRGQRDLVDVGEERLLMRLATDRRERTPGRLAETAFRERDATKSSLREPRRFLFSEDAGRHLSVELREPRARCVFWQAIVNGLFARKCSPCRRRTQKLTQQRSIRRRSVSNRSLAFEFFVFVLGGSQPQSRSADP